MTTTYNYKQCTPLDERIKNARDYLADAERIEHPSAVKGIIDELGELFVFVEVAEEWAELLDAYEYADITDEEWTEARRFLAIMRESVDAIAADVAGWVVPGGRQDQVRLSMTMALTMALKLDELAHRMAVRRSSLRGRSNGDFATE